VLRALSYSTAVAVYSIIRTIKYKIICYLLSPDVSWRQVQPWREQAGTQVGVPVITLTQLPLEMHTVV